MRLSGDGVYSGEDTGRTSEKKALQQKAGDSVGDSALSGTGVPSYPVSGSDPYGCEALEYSGDGAGGVVSD